jgi:hypothetical protein
MTPLLPRLGPLARTDLKFTPKSRSTHRSLLACERTVALSALFPRTASFPLSDGVHIHHADIRVRAGQLTRGRIGMDTRSATTNLTKFWKRLREEQQYNSPSSCLISLMPLTTFLSLSLSATIVQTEQSRQDVMFSHFPQCASMGFIARAQHRGSRDTSITIIEINPLYRRINGLNATLMALAG